MFGFLKFSSVSQIVEIWPVLLLQNKSTSQSVFNQELVHPKGTAKQSNSGFKRQKLLSLLKCKLERAIQDWFDPPQYQSPRLLLLQSSALQELHSQVHPRTSVPVRRKGKGEDGHFTGHTHTTAPYIPLARAKPLVLLGFAESGDVES